MDKSIFNFKILKKDGTIIDLHEKNLFINSFRIPSPNPKHTVDQVAAVHGSRYFGTTLEERVISSQITVESNDYVDFDLFRDEIFKMFNPLEKFYIIRDLQPGKRIEVSVNNSFEIDYIFWEAGEFPIEFVIHSVFLESVGTTMDPFTFEAEVWQIGQGLIGEDLIYKHSTKSFSIFNAGDIEVDPRWLPLIINYKGASTNLKIKNTTTGNEWAYTGTSNAGDTIKLDGIRSTKNGLSITRATNKKMLILAPGWNDFTLTGTSGSFEIIFDFRFYYL